MSILDVSVFMLEVMPEDALKRMGKVVGRGCDGDAAHRGGVAGFVLGTTLLFGKEKPYGETLKDIRELRF